MFKPIEWSEEFEPNDNCMYNHVVGKTPLGNFLISWKGWKDYSIFEVEELPFQSELINSVVTLGDTTLVGAKEQCEKLYQEKLGITRYSDRIGRVVKHVSGGAAYVVTGDYGSRLTAVSTIDITNLAEWQFL